MKRRAFTLGIPAVAALALTGCKSKPGDELLGYWIRHHENGRIAAMLKIRREGDVLTITTAQFGMSGSESPPRETVYPLAFSRDLGHHGIQTQMGLVPVQRIGEELGFDLKRFTRSTPEQYAKWLTEVRPMRMFH